MPVYRVRECSGRKGGSNHYHHADIIAPHWKTALCAAKEGRVNNWRWIDTFDTANNDYKEHEFLYRVTGQQARHPEPPISKELHSKRTTLSGEILPKLNAVIGVRTVHLWLYPHFARVFIQKGKRDVRNTVEDILCQEFGFGSRQINFRIVAGT